MIMRGGQRYRRLIGVLVGVVGAAALVGGGPTGADTATAAPLAAVAAALPDPKIKGAPCQRRPRVTVVVDFRDLENARGKRLNLVKLGCAGAQPDNGLAAIVAAGYQLQHRNGLVCRLDGKPRLAQTDCVSEGFWSYWHAERAGPWEFSDVGAGEWQPPRGSVEGWSWNWYDDPRAAPRVDPADLGRPPQADGGAGGVVEP